MAIQKVIITDYPDGSRVMSGIRNNKGIPVFKENDTVTATRVTTWYDGTPMDNSKADGKVYLRHKASGDFYLINLPNWGETFLEKDAIVRDSSTPSSESTVRELTSTEILLLKMKYYKGVKVSGYYKNGDTPKAIEYLLSTTSATDDGGSVIEVGSVKLEHDFKGIVDVKYFGIFNNFDDTQKLQDVININQGSFIYFNDLNYFIDGTLNNDMGVIIPSNTHISQAEGSVFKIKPTNHGKYGGFTFNGSLNYVSRLVVKGERSAHLGTTGEWGMGVNLIDAKRVKIDYLQCDDCWGDGLYIGKSTENKFSEDVYIGKFYADNNRRQGISFITGKNILIDYAKISNTNGAPPAAGIDFESNHSTDRLDGIVINKLETSGNELCGVLFDPQKLNNTSIPIDIKINSWNSYNERAFRTLGDQPTHVVGKIVIKGLMSFNAPIMAVEVRNYYNAPDITFENPLIVNPNESSRTDYYGSGIMVYKDQTDTAPVEGHYSPYIQIINPTVIDNRASKRMYHGIVCYSYRSTASFIKNVKIINPTILGNTSSPISYNSNLNVEDGLNNLVKVLNSDQTFNHNTNNYKTFTNLGETTSRTVTLVGTYSGSSVKVKVESGQPLILSVGAGSIMTLNVNTIQSDQIGSELELECINSSTNTWRVVRGIGRWTSGSKSFRFSGYAEASLSIAGTVKQNALINNSNLPNATPLANFTATDVAGLVTELNSNLVTKFNTHRTLTDDLKTRINNHFDGERSSGQMSST